MRDEGGERGTRHLVFDCRTVLKESLEVDERVKQVVRALDSPQRAHELLLQGCSERELEGGEGVAQLGQALLFKVPRLVTVRG
jgi:hypothetical protein